MAVYYAGYLAAQASAAEREEDAFADLIHAQAHEPVEDEASVAPDALSKDTDMAAPDDIEEHMMDLLSTSEKEE